MSLYHPPLSCREGNLFCCNLGERRQRGKEAKGQRGKEAKGQRGKGAKGLLTNLEETPYRLGVLDVRRLRRNGSNVMRSHVPVRISIHILYIHGEYLS
ncbi:hypothetical protein POVWA2_018880 [Plasmodium ovale wallikeri]|uniref:Uncharacterized protein n=1 Tax=Plasmodium ovale wallikeri TaxID=864142 RepID=A0A1A8YQH6_PLAOA|nr:hypothetical protein POVWA1_018980 [Plasmodium ovale wallikeri]SBT34229.1 hypothetical protein POVWA2_018880 [Plasmodium ovale wallikeri]